GAILEAGAIAVADRIEGAENIVGELARFRKHRLDHVIGKVAIKSFGQGRAETSGVLERKGNIGNRRPVGHRLVSEGYAFVPGGRRPTLVVPTRYSWGTSKRNG